MSITFSCSSIKGGVSKTTSTINLAAALAEQQYRCLVVDFDPQFNASSALNVPVADLEYTIANVIMPLKNGQRVPIEKTILQTAIPGLDIAPSGLPLTMANLMLTAETARESILRKELRKPAIQNSYDFIFIDTAPAVDLLLLNALGASDYVIGCSTCEFLALNGIDLMLDSFNKVKDNGINENLNFFGVIATKNNNTKHAKDTLATLRNRYTVLGVTPTSTKANEATVEGVPIVVNNKNNPVSAEYRKIAEIIMEKHEKDEL